MPKRQLDHTDILILNILQNEGEITNKALSKRLGITPPTTLKRVLRLKKLNLLPSCHYQLNKELLGYKEVFLLKLSTMLSETEVKLLEQHLIKDSMVERLWTLRHVEAIGTTQYRLMLRVPDQMAFEAWYKKLIGQFPCVIESEQAEILLKDRSSLKLSYKDLEHLRDLES